jgi:bacteriorhodopsin
MAVLPTISYGEYNAVYNALSFGIATMGACSLFVLFQSFNVIKKYRTALLINFLVTAIATYHYVRIFNSFDSAYAVAENKVDYEVVKTGVAFNNAYRYVDWLLTVPLLLIELILVMGLSEEQTVSKSWQLGVASAIMVAVGYPGEISDDVTTRWICWAISMVFFLFVLYNLLVGLANASADARTIGATEESESEAEDGGQSLVKTDGKVTSLISAARYLTAVSWLTYPFVYLIKTLNISGSAAMTGVQVGYSVADILAKAVFGLLIWKIAQTKSDLEEAATQKAVYFAPSV